MMIKTESLTEAVEAGMPARSLKVAGMVYVVGEECYCVFGMEIVKKRRERERSRACKYMSVRSAHRRSKLSSETDGSFLLIPPPAESKDRGRP